MGFCFMSDTKLKKLLELTAVINSSLDIASIREHAIEAAAELVEAEGGSLLFIDEATGDLYFDAVAGDKGAAIKPISLKKGEGLAGWVAANQKPLIVNDVQADPRFTGRVDQQSGFVTRSVASTPVRAKNRMIGVLQAVNKREGPFTEADLLLLDALAGQVAIAIENARLYDDLRGAFHATIQTLADAMDLRDPHSSGHARRVAAYSVAIGRTLGMNAKQVSTVKLAAILHDIGMIGVSDENMHSGNPAVRAEVTRRHAELGEQIISRIRQLGECAPAIRHHHEHYDGRGLPDRLKGAQIPLVARIIAVADTFDTLTLKDNGRGMSREQALARLEELAGTQLDPPVVAAFIRAYEAYRLDQVG